jgi:DNA polymerase III delta prime subunit
MECINNKNISYFSSTLNELIHSKNFYLNYNYRIIIFNNFNKISYNLQNKLRVIIEKYRLTTIFILITNKFTSVINPIKSRCLSLRIPGLTPKKKRELSRNKILYLSYDKRSIIYDKIYQINNKNEIEYYSELNEGLFLNYKTIYENIYERIQKIYHGNKLTKQNIETIREISYMIEKYNLYDIYKELLSLFISDPKYTYTIKIELIQFFSNSEYNYQKSYRSLIHIENLFIQLLNYLA